MNFRRLETQIIQDEGYRSRAYWDEIGKKWTIGYGTTRWFQRAVNKGDRLLPVDARRFLRADLYTALIDAQKLFPRFEEMNSVRQEVLVNMSFQLGRPRLSLFVRLREAADSLDYEKMADEMFHSLWYRQSGRRSERLVVAMRIGDF